MPDVNDVLAANRAAVIDLVAAAERSAATWTTPRAPGKWSPSQVVEHVARTLEESANIVSGAPSKFKPLPAFLRPLARLFFYRILKKNAFPKAKAAKAFNPTSGPATPAQARARLEGALARFDQECRRRAASGQNVVSTGFGTVSVEDYAMFNGGAHSPPLQTDARRNLKTARLQGEQLTSVCSRRRPVPSSAAAAETRPSRLLARALPPTPRGCFEFVLAFRRSDRRR